MHRGALSAAPRTNQNHHHSSAPALNTSSPTGTSPQSDNSVAIGHLDFAVTCLWILTPIAATFSLVSVTVAVTTNQWLATEEKMRNPSYNGTGEKDYLSKRTISGLWTLCYTNPGELEYQCQNIDYFSKEEYSPDPNDSTMAIPYAVTNSTVFFLVALLLVCAGYCSCLVGHCARHRRFHTFVSGVIFIVSGLIMLFGLIMYISVFKAEVGSKLRPRSQLAPPSFTYRYGFSFLLYVSGFITTEVAGTSAIFLFIYSHQREWQRKRLKESRKIPNSTSSLNYLHFDHHNMYPCRRHPQAYINSNSAIHIPVRYPSPVHQRRYFFSKEPITESPCSIHRNAPQLPRDVMSNSLKDVSTFYDFPPPPTISYGFHEDFQRRSLSHFPIPRDATTNTVSTTADVNLCSDTTTEQFDDYSPSIQHEHEFVTFDLDEPLPLAVQMRNVAAATNSSVNNDRGASNSARSTVRSEFSIESLRRTTPV